MRLRRTRMNTKVAPMFLRQFIDLKPNCLK